MSRLLALALLVALTACGTTTRFTATNPSPHPLVAKPADQVHVYTTGAPQIAYVEVGIIQARQSSEYSMDDMPEIIREMRAEAGRIGCDGVIINGVSDKTETTSNFDGSNPNTHTLEGFWGACIVYLSDEEADVPTATR